MPSFFVSPFWITVATVGPRSLIGILVRGPDGSPTRALAVECRSCNDNTRTINVPDADGTIVHSLVIREDDDERATRASRVASICDTHEDR